MSSVIAAWICGSSVSNIEQILHLLRRNLHVDEIFEVVALFSILEKRRFLSSWCYTTLEKNDLSCSCFINLEVNVVDGKNNWAFIWSSLSAELHQLPDRPNCPMECNFANIMVEKSVLYRKIAFFPIMTKG